MWRRILRNKMRDVISTRSVGYPATFREIAALSMTSPVIINVDKKLKLKLDKVRLEPASLSESLAPPQRALRRCKLQPP